jgi:hypothetical protein
MAEAPKLDKPGFERKVSASSEQNIDQQVIPDQRVGPLNGGIEHE